MWIKLYNISSLLNLKLWFLLCALHAVFSKADSALREGHIKLIYCDWLFSIEPRRSCQKQVNPCMNTSISIYELIVLIARLVPLRWIRVRVLANMSDFLWSYEASFLKKTSSDPFNGNKTLLFLRTVHIKTCTAKSYFSCAVCTAVLQRYFSPA